MGRRKRLAWPDGLGKRPYKGRPVSGPYERREIVRTLCLIAACIVIGVGVSWLVNVIAPPPPGGRYI